MKCSAFFSLPKSSRGSDQRRSHIGPNAGGSLNLSSCPAQTERNRKNGVNRLKEPRQEPGRYLSNIVKIVDFRRESSVHAEKLLIHEGSKRQAVESLHAGVIDAFRILNLACFRWKRLNIQVSGRRAALSN